MPPLHIFLLIVVCLLWASNAIVSKLAFDAGTPPLIYGAIRSALVAVAVFPWLFPLPKRTMHLATASFLIGGGTFGLAFAALAISSPSAVIIVQQLSVPLTALFSVALLGEVIGLRRGTGIAMALCGVLLVLWQPGRLTMDPGLLLAAASALTSSLGVIMLKQIPDVRPMQFQAWVGLTGICPLLILSMMFETKHIQRICEAGYVFIFAIVFSAFVVSIITQTIYFWIIRKYEASLISPLMIMVPIFTIFLGVTITGDVLDIRMAAGAILAIAGVLILVRKMPQTFA